MSREQGDYYCTCLNVPLYSEAFFCSFNFAFFVPVVLRVRDWPNTLYVYMFLVKRNFINIYFSPTLSLRFCSL